MRRPLWGAAGLVLLGLGLFALREDIPVANAIWYAPAWYGYLLLVDAIIFARRGSSFVSGPRRELAALLFWSLPFWFFFEASNLVLKNWYYVFALRNRWASAAMAALAFATVLPACLFHADLLEAFGAWRQGSCRSAQVGPRTLRVVAAGGLLCVALPLAFPRVAFPLIWFAPIGLEAVTYRAGAPSLLRDLAEGNCGRLWRLLAGGFWAGGVWELFNFPARCKWIYTVPGFQDWKVFEMPLAGFLGFPVLAVSAFSFFSFARSRMLREGLLRKAAPILALLFCAAIEAAVERQTVRSLRPLLSELSGLDAAALTRLEMVGVPTPEQLVRAASEGGVEALSKRTGLTAKELSRAVGQARLSLHKGMGTERAALLERAGVATVAQLASQEPEALWGQLAALAREAGEEPPRLPEVRVWVRAAHDSGGRPVR